MKYYSTRYFLIAILLILYLSNITGQTYDPLSYFPHHLGDYWEYLHYDPFGPPGVASDIVVLDSILPDSNFIVHINGSTYYEYLINTTTYEVTTPIFGNNTLYKLDAELGDWWYYCYRDSLYFSRARIIDEYPSILFNIPTTVKVIDYWSIYPEDSLWDWRHYIASGFGLIGTDIEGAIPNTWINCSIIENIEYGNCSLLDIEKNLISKPTEDFELYQNFPNPFNQSTHITFKLPRAVFVDLTIYNMLGEKIVTFVNRIYLAGIHSIEWNGRDGDLRDVPSGMYFVKLNAGVFTKFIKIILLK